MKTVFTLLTWCFGITAGTALFNGVMLADLDRGFSFFLLFVFFPIFGLLSVFFHKKGKKIEWEDDFFYLLFKFSSSKGGDLKQSLKNELDKTKEKMKDSIDKK
tara:strand:+ start:107 stop:415 length:309 start_codon:yes stop_codon:yes gene_type:complete